MLFSNNKGQGIGVVVFLIAILISGAILFVLIRNLSLTSYKLVDRETCRLSVLAKSKSVVLGKEDVLGQIELKCPTTIVELSKKNEGSFRDLFSNLFGRSEKIGNANLPLRSFKIEKRSDIERIIADEMYDCWYKFGAGKINFFGKFDGDRKCLICSVVKPSDKIEEEYSVIENFESYLFEQEIPGKGISYYEYFTQDEGLLFSTDEETGTINLPLDNDLAIIYMIHQTGRGKYLGIFTAVGLVVGTGIAIVLSGPVGLGLGISALIGAGVAGGTIIYGTVGEAAYKAIMLPIPYGDISRECDVLE